MQAEARTASLQARAWVLQLAALELHTADAALPAHRESVAALLEGLFATPPATAAGIAMPAVI